MSGASEDKVVAVQHAISAIDEIIFHQVSPGATNEFTASLATFKDVDPTKNKVKKIPGEMPTMYDVIKFDPPELDVTNNEYMLETDCPHSSLASSVGVFTCNILKIQVNRKYGRYNTSTANVNAGIAQQLLR